MKYALLVVLAACNPNLVAETPSPLGRVARLDAVEGVFSTKYYRLELSQGVAFAFTCSRGAPCEHVTVTSDDIHIAEPRKAALAALRPQAPAIYPSSELPRQPAAATVIVGRAPGKTNVHLHSEEGDRLIVVTVVAPPAT